MVCVQLRRRSPLIACSGSTRFEGCCHSGFCGFRRVGVVAVSAHVAGSAAYKQLWPIVLAIATHSLSRMKAASVKGMEGPRSTSACLRTDQHSHSHLQSQAHEHLHTGDWANYSVADVLGARYSAWLADHTRAR
eukprot:9139117-Alexandrium_andersonii.AAC.1